ncbi:hypothetical protein NLI96_g7039 [Meripilus lineatus]|uniref:Beta-lactamase-related domain-containing protein n=1 Tax=Meripilus lineatus TaxID=2056292 RepID=A0AAD5V0A4_9APHY|nr:hypothetical protein NLI96_g7039 [Physisporinus lineatus]
MKAVVFLKWCSLAVVSYSAQVPLTLNSSSTIKTDKSEPGKFKRFITPQLSALVDLTIKATKTPGLSLGVVQVVSHTKDVHTEFGTWGTMTEDGDKTMQETLFAIGSCSKAFLAAAMGILMEDYAQGKNVTPLPDGLDSFTWKTKVQDLFPGEDSVWKLKDDWASQKVNIEDMLTHVSGLPSHDLSYGPSDAPIDLVEKLRFLKPQFELREQWAYNNQMYVLGAHIISTYSGKPFTQFVRERIFKPLKMTSTTYSGKEAKLTGNFSHAFTLHESNIRRIPFPFEDENISEFIAGAGGIISNTGDMLKWVGMLLNGGVDPITGTTVIPSSVFTEVTTARSLVMGTSDRIGGSIVGYGLGWLRTSAFGHEVLQHGGGLPGFISQVTFLPLDGVGIVAFVNQASPVPNFVSSWIILDVLGMITLDQSFTDNNFTRLNHGLPLADVKKSPRPPQQSLTSIAPELPIEAYVGTYSDPGYGGFTICTSSSTSDYCKSTLFDFSKVFPDDPPSGEPVLYGSWPKIWSSHLRAVPQGKNSFLFRFLGMYPEGFGKNTSPFYDENFQVDVQAEFDVEDGVVKGLAVFEGVKYVPGEPPEGDLKEVATVYYVKE